MSSSSLSRAATPWANLASISALPSRSARSSSSVSNSEASWANSSSSSGSSRSLTAVTVTVQFGVLALLLAAGERGGEGLGLVGGHPDECLVEAVEHVAGADLVGDAGHRVDLVAVDLGREVHRDEVTGGDDAVDALEGAEAGAQVVEALLDGALLDGRLVDGDLDGGEVGQVDLGALVDLGDEDEVLAVRGRHREVGDLGLAERADRVLLERLPVEGRQRIVDGLLEDGGAADALLDDPCGDLALAEAGHLDVLTDVLDGRIEARLELLERDLDGQLDPGRAEGLERTLHCGYSIWRGRSSSHRGTRRDVVVRRLRARSERLPGRAGRTRGTAHRLPMLSAAAQKAKCAPGLSLRRTYARRP